MMTMADESTTSALMDTQAPAPVPELPTEHMDTDGDAPISKEDEETAAKQATTEMNPPDGGDATEVAERLSSADPAVDETPTANNKSEKRKSVGTSSEHKGRKLNKKKSMPTLHLDCKPGEFYWARLKGYPPWPAIICDEQMLPESLLASRPVSTMRPDGSLREDFKEGGKNAKERTFPIMFLSTNEFAWMVNTSLSPLDPAECKEKPKGKMTKALTSAYELAAEGHDLQYFKDLLVKWQEEEQAIQKEMAEVEARRLEEKAVREAKPEVEDEAHVKEKKKKKAPRKSKGGDGDVEMADADAPKSLKKRKKEAESDAEGVKPKKTPKVTKLNAPKTPNGETNSSTKKSTSKPKKKVSVPKDDDEEAAKPQMTEEEKRAQREKTVLYLRHRLQKGFLSRDQAPQESEMSNMADFFMQLESFENLEPSIIRTTKIHKVLKAIVKLATIPREEEFNFKKRSAALLEVWNKRMEADSEAAQVSASEPKSAPVEGKPETEQESPKTNGENKTDELVKEDGEAKENAEKENEMNTVDAVDKPDQATAGTADDDKAPQALELPEHPAEKKADTATVDNPKDVAEVGDASKHDTAEAPSVDVS